MQERQRAVRQAHFARAKNVSPPRRGDAPLQRDAQVELRRGSPGSERRRGRRSSIAAANRRRATLQSPFAQRRRRHGVVLWDRHAAVEGFAASAVTVYPPALLNDDRSHPSDCVRVGDCRSIERDGKVTDNRICE